MSYFPNDFLKRPLALASQDENFAWPKISIVMPSFNQVDFIERSILSVINQNYPYLQFIIIDGGSTDGTVEIIRKYEDYLDFWVSETDKGQSDALNKGFVRAVGDVYGWLNSDDLYLPNAFFYAIEAFTHNSDKSVVFGDWLSIDENDNVLDFNHAFDFSVNHFKYEGFHLNAQSMFWRSSVHREFGGFHVDLYNTMDYQMILEFGVKFGQEKFLRISKTLAAFRRHEGQKTGGVTDRVIREHREIAVFYGYTDKYHLAGKLKRLIYRARRAYWYMRRGGLLYLIARFKTSFQHANRRASSVRSS